jgi:hypothetical protein
MGMDFLEKRGLWARHPQTKDGNKTMYMDEIVWHTCFLLKKYKKKPGSLNTKKILVWQLSNLQIRAQILHISKRNLNWFWVHM